MNAHTLSPDLQEFLAKPTTTNFLHSAREFITLLELDTIDSKEFYKRAHTALADLYACGQRLEIVEIKSSRADRDFDRDELFENKHAYKISDLDGNAYYWEVFDTNYDKDADPVQGWLVDDFADIYHDLKIELNKIDKIGSNEAVEDALWTLKWSFKTHWGHHCVSALRAFHFLNYDGRDVI